MVTKAGVDMKKYGAIRLFVITVIAFVLGSWVYGKEHFGFWDVFILLWLAAFAGMGGQSYVEKLKKEDKEKKEYEELKKKTQKYFE
nr:hypothetical protein 8 [bacterium]